MKKSIVILSAILFLYSCTDNKPEEIKEESETFSELEKTLEWYHDAKFGMFIHWGLYSVPGKHEWFRSLENVPNDEYRAIKDQFNPVKFDAEEIVKVAKSAGMRWITITSKHHDGFAIYNSRADTFSINATPFGKGGRDPLEELADACRKHGLKLGFYYSHYQDWDHPGGGARVAYRPKIESAFRQYMDDKALPQVKEILTQYGDIAIIWFDTPMQLTGDEANEFRKLVRNTSPGTLIGGRLDGLTGDFWSMPDNRVPDNPFGEPWETCMTSNHAWGWREPMKETRPAKEMIQHLCTIVSRGGNFLLNTGPSPDGALNKNDIVQYKIVGKWLETNGEAIYGTDMNPFFDSPYLCTTKGNRIYFHLFEWPEGALEINRVKNIVTKVWMLKDKAQKALKFTTDGGVVRVTLPEDQSDSINSILVVETDGFPVVENSYPTAGENGIIIIPAGEFNICHEKFSSFDQDKNMLHILDSKRAWVNGWFEVKTPGKYQIVVRQSKADSCRNSSYYMVLNGNKYLVPVDSSFDSSMIVDQQAGLIEFKHAGVFNFTIRPSGWYLQAKKVLVKIERIQLIPE